MSRNEIRDLEDLNPFEGGDEYLLPLNMTVEQPRVGGTNEKGTPPPRISNTRAKSTRTEITARYRPLLRSVFAKIVARESREVLAAAERELTSRGEASFSAWLESYYTGAKGWMKDVMSAVMTAYADEIAAAAASEIGKTGTPQDWTQMLDIWAKQYSGKSLSELRAIQADGDYETFRDMLEDWEEDRVEDETNSNSVLVAALAALAAWKGLGVAKIAWAASSDSCPLCDSIDGQVVGIGGAFSASAAGTAREGSHPPLHKGCQCTLVAQ